jgi:hypothetical protein
LNLGFCGPGSSSFWLRWYLISSAIHNLLHHWNLMGWIWRSYVLPRLEAELDASGPSLQCQQSYVAPVIAILEWSIQYNNYSGTSRCRHQTAVPIPNVLPAPMYCQLAFMHTVIHYVSDWQRCLTNHIAGTNIFFKYFPIHTLDFEKLCADDIVCSSLGLNELKTRYFEKISKSNITRPMWKDFKNNGTTWKLVCIPLKWVPMLWGFNSVVKSIFFAFWFWWQK